MVKLKLKTRRFFGGLAGTVHPSAGWDLSFLNFRFLLLDSCG